MSRNSVSVSLTTTRRYVLGCHGLWPGRRFTGLAGTADAIRASQTVQIDPLQIVRRSHDLTLHARVEGYQPEMLDQVMYAERQFVDYGGILLIYPREDLPYLRSIMRTREARTKEWASEQRDLIDMVREEIRSRGPLSSRDFKNSDRIPAGYSTEKQTSVALYHLWLVGEIITHSRRRNERVYDLVERAAGRIGNNVECADAEVAERHLFLKATHDAAFGTATEIGRRARAYMGKLTTADVVRLASGLVAEGELTVIHVEARNAPRYVPTAYLGILNALESGKVPEEWTTNHPLSASEVTFIAPLDNVVWDRGKTRELFAFDYVWEVYKPARLRTWGYYTLPILWGDKLVGRMDAKFDRKARSLNMLGFWLEDAATGNDPQFADALAAGLLRLARWLGAVSADLDAIRPTGLRRKAAKGLRPL